MGLGLNPTDLFTVVERGIDMFDCVAPTRLARHGIIFTKNKKNKHRLNITNSKFTTDKKSIDKNCHCSTCQNYSRAYLHHLFKAQEMTAMRLATIHNIHFFLNLMVEMRKAIKKDEFLKLKKEWF
jgi:queuine tRNA-ribosyltransferase